MPQQNKTFFAPHLAIRVLQPAMDFYIKAFGAIVLRQWNNDDGSVHVAEMMIDGAMFHLHEEVSGKNQLSPDSVGATTSLIGLFTSDPDRLVDAATRHGGRIIDAIQDYDYGYRQGTLEDPFGHQWLIQKKI
jgi:PhnB protein